jgi:hypothetical protein
MANPGFLAAMMYSMNAAGNSGGAASGVQGLPFGCASAGFPPVPFAFQPNAAPTQIPQMPQAQQQPLQPLPAATPPKADKQRKRRRHQHGSEPTSPSESVISLATSAVTEIRR